MNSDPTFDPIGWLAACEAALVDADELASFLARSSSADTASELDSLRLRIAVLRAELKRARAQLLGGAKGSRIERRSPAPWPWRGENRRS